MLASRLALAACSLCALGTAQTTGVPTVTGSFVTGSMFSGGVAFDPVTDETWIIDANAQVISRFDPAGTPNMAYLAPPPAGQVVARPVGGALDALTGNLFVIDESEDVLELDAVGNVVNAWSAAPAITDGSGLAIDPVNRVLFISDDTANILQRFTLDGIPIGPAIDVGTRAGSIDGDGLTCNWLTRSLWIGNDTGDRLLEVDANGNLLQTISLTNIPDATTGGTITISPEGLTIDTARGELIVSSSDGGIVYRIAGAIPAPIGAVTPFGTGCPDSGGRIPQLGMNGLIQENSSYDFIMQASIDGTSNAAAYFIIGVVPVTVDLSVINAPGCTLLATPEIGVHGPVPFNSNNRAGFGLGLGVGLGGLTLRWQGAVYPDINSSGLAMSNGLITTIQ